MENRPPPELPEPVIHGPDQLREGIERLQRQIGELEAFDSSSVKARHATETRAIQAAIAETLAKTFGYGTPSYNLYAPAARLDNGPMYLSGRPPAELVVEWIQDGKAKSLELLKQAVKGLQDDLTELGGAADQAPAAEQAPYHVTSDGRDGAEGEIEKKLRLISAAALFLSTCVLFFHPRKVKTKAQEPRGAVSCKKCGTRIAVSNPSRIQQDFSAKCPACGTSNSYQQVDLSLG
jgi:hypothetical protein